MGVTNRNEIYYKNPECISSTESLHIPQNSLTSSSTGSIPVQIIRVSRRQKRQKTALESPSNLPRNLGRRRLRRFRAVAELFALIEEDESETFLEDGIPHNSLFTTVINNPDLEYIWEQLTTDDDTETSKLCDETSKNKTSRSKSDLVSYRNISFHVKMTFKMMRSVYELEKTETEILNFFTNTPTDVYVCSNKTSFQRLLIHGISQYYCLKSTSFDTKDGKRTIKVENPNSFNHFTGQRLYSIVEDNHSKRI